MDVWVRLDYPLCVTIRIGAIVIMCDTRTTFFGLWMLTYINLRACLYLVRVAKLSSSPMTGQDVIHMARKPRVHERQDNEKVLKG